MAPRGTMPSFHQVSSVFSGTRLTKDLFGFGFLFFHISSLGGKFIYPDFSAELIIFLENLKFVIIINNSS